MGKTKKSGGRKANSKILKIVFGVIFVVGGIGNFRESIEAALFGIVAGCLLVAWAFQGGRKKVTPAQASTSETDLIADTFKRIVTESTQKVDYTIPERIGDCLRLYTYTNLRVEPTAEAIQIAEKMQSDTTWTFSVANKSGKIELSYKDELFGVLCDKADMVADWLKRGDPLIIGLKTISNDDNLSCQAFAAFYRDEQKRLAYRENEVVKLVKYASSDVQDNIGYMHEGEKVDLEEYYDGDDSVVVSSCGLEIGQLPKKQVRKFIEEGCAGAFVEEIEYDYEKDRYIPHIRIYW